MYIILIILALIAVYLYTNRETMAIGKWYPYNYNRYGFEEEQCPIGMDSSQPILYDWTNDDGNHFYRYQTNESNTNESI